MGFNNVVDFNGETFKSLSCIHMAGLYARCLIQQGFMSSKADIDKVSVVIPCTLRKVSDHLPVAWDGIHLPYHVIAETQMIDYFIQSF